jgi:hypothetical protein
MIVTVTAHVLPDGEVTSVDINDMGRYHADPVYRAMADRARQAVLRASPFKDLPTEKYEGKEGWKLLEITFDPSEMLY